MDIQALVDEMTKDEFIELKKLWDKKKDTCKHPNMIMKNGWETTWECPDCNYFEISGY